jgi:hypothetical protein
LAVAQRAFETHQPKSNWDELNPEMRNWWCEIADTILRAATDHVQEQKEKIQQMENNS